jgi:DNA polymerase-3 subunit beta
MILNINKESLLDPLQKVFGVIEKRQTLPILSNVFFCINDGTLKLTGTDLEVQISSNTSIDSSDVFKTTIPGRKLLDICRSLPDESKINLDFGINSLILKSGKSRFTLRTLPADDYPLFDETNYTDQINIDQSILVKVFSKTVFCMAQQDVRYYLNGLMMEVVKGELQTVASDGHRLALSKNKLIDENQSISQLIIPRKAAHELIKLMEKHVGVVDLRVSKNSIKFIIGDVELSAKLIDGRFPDFNNVIPDESKHCFTINKLSFKSALSRVSILSNEKYKGIRLDLKSQLIVINANNPEQDEAEEEVVVDYDSEEMSMGFNSSYLMDALNVIESEDVLVSFTDTNSSCLLENPSDKSSRFVIMPMRI